MTMTVEQFATAMRHVGDRQPCEACGGSLGQGVVVSQLGLGVLVCQRCEGLRKLVRSWAWPHIERLQWAIRMAPWPLPGINQPPHVSNCRCSFAPPATPAPPAPIAPPARPAWHRPLAYVALAAVSSLWFFGVATLCLDLWRALE